LNFQNLGNAFLALMRASTGEDWHYILHAISRKKGIGFECKENPNYQDYKLKGQTVGCGNAQIAKAFILSYTFIVNMIFLNLFIAIILQGFDESDQDTYKAFSDADKDHFKNCWA